MEGAEYSWGSFPSLADLEYVKSEGVNLVRLPIAWEMMQPTLNGRAQLRLISQGLKVSQQRKFTWHKSHRRPA